MHSVLTMNATSINLLATEKEKAMKTRLSCLVPVFCALALFFTTPIAQAASVTPILHYTFDTADISGTTVTDFGSGGNNGTIVGTVPNPAGQFGQALSFNGNVSSTFVDVNTALLSTSDAFQPYSISFWIKTSGTGGVFSQYNAAAPNATRWGIRSDSQAGRLSWWHGNDGERVRATTITSDNTWHHTVFIKDAAQNLSVYTDGVLDTDSLFSQTDISAFQAANTNIGTFTTTTVLPFTGLIDEVWVFNQALTADQVFALYSINATELPVAPEPSSFLLLGLGVFGLVRQVRPRNKKSSDQGDAR